MRLANDEIMQVMNNVIEKINFMIDEIQRHN